MFAVWFPHYTSHCSTVKGFTLHLLRSQHRSCCWHSHGMMKHLPATWGFRHPPVTAATIIKRGEAPAPVSPVAHLARCSSSHPNSYLGFQWMQGMAKTFSFVWGREISSISSPKGLEGHGLFGGGEVHLEVNLQEKASVSASFRGRGMRDRFGP